MTISLNLALISTVLAIFGGLLAVAVAARKAATTVAKEVVIEHERQCKVRTETMAEMDKLEDRLGQRLSGIEDELRSLNHYLRNGGRRA